MDGFKKTFTYVHRTSIHFFQVLSNFNKGVYEHFACSGYTFVYMHKFSLSDYQNPLICLSVLSPPKKSGKKASIFLSEHG